MNHKTFRLLNKMMIRTIKQNLMQFIAIIVIGAIAVTLFVGLHANADVFEAQVNQVYTEGNLADLWVTTNTYDKEDFDKINSIVGDSGVIESRLYIPSESSAHSLFITVVDKIPEVSRPYGNITSNENNTEDDFIYIDNDLMTNSDSYSTLYTLGGNFSFTLDISSYSLGALASLLEDYVKEGGENIFAKDSIMLHTTADGTMDYPENITKASYNYSVVLLSNKRLTRIVKELLEENYKDEVLDTLYKYFTMLLGFNGNGDSIANPNQYVIKVSDESNVSKIKNSINSYYKSKGFRNNLYMITERSGMPFYMTIDNDVKQARGFTYVFPFVFFLVGVLVILTTISQMILKDRTQIGTLKAMGVSRGLIMLHYGALSSTLVLIGIAIGLIIGPILLPNILGKKYAIIYHLPKATYHFPVLYGILTICFFVGIAIFVTYIIARKEIAMKPSESMRPQVVSFKKHRKNSILKRTRFFSLKMAYRNISINIGKSIMVIVGVLGCTALLVCGFGIEDTLNYGISNDLGIFYSSDLTIVLNNYKLKEELDLDMNKIGDFTYYEYCIHTATTAYKTSDAQVSSTLYIIPDDSTAVKVDFAKEGTAVSTSVAETLGLKIGDMAHFTFGGQDYSIKVDKIYDAFYYNGFIIHEGASIFKNTKDFRYTIIEAGIKDKTKLDDYLSYFEGLSYVNEARTPNHWVEMTNDLMSGISVMTNAVKIFAILLGIVVIYNLSLMNFKERSRDIATLKVLGFGQSEILRSLLIESLSLTLIGVILGMALGYPFMLAVLKTNIVSLVSYLYHIFIRTYLLAFLLTFGVALAINMLLSLRIRKIKMVESLKSVE